MHRGLLLLSPGWFLIAEPDHTELPHTSCRLEGSAGRPGWKKRLCKREITDAEAIRNGKKQVVYKGKHHVICEIISDIRFHSHEGDRVDEDYPGNSEINDWLVIEDSFDFGSVFPYCISNIIDQVEDDNRPGSVDGVKSLGKDGSREYGKGDNKGEHNNKGVS